MDKMDKIDLSRDLLEQLRIKRGDAIAELHAVLLSNGVLPDYARCIKRPATHNYVVDWLDNNYPGWRGYPNPEIIRRLPDLT